MPYKTNYHWNSLDFDSRGGVCFFRFLIMVAAGAAPQWTGRNRQRRARRNNNLGSTILGQNFILAVTEDEMTIRGSCLLVDW